MDKSTETSNSKVQSTVVVALVIGLLAGFFIGRSLGYKEESGEQKAKIENVDVSTAKDSEVSSRGENAKEGVKTETVFSGNATGEVTAEDQNAGLSVAVKKVTLSDAGWVVVREDTGNGMGNILGARWLPAGTVTDVSVDLLRVTETKKNYFVALYTDNGDKKFDKTIDLPIATDGKVVSAVFLAK